MKKVAFLTGTRADFGKIKSLISILESHPKFDPYVFVTGMHLQEEYGFTLIEVERCGFKHIHTFANHTHETTMDLTLAKTIQGFSSFVKEVSPDLIIVHGDRVEALAGATVGSLNNILVAHIEGGEISGTIDELIRHATSKMSHIHFVANKLAKTRLLQMGEIPESVYIIGSPDVDIMFSENLPNIAEVQRYYEIPFQDYGIALFHPITTEVESIEKYISNFTKALVDSGKNFVVIYPNNDVGSSTIISAFKKLKENNRFRVIPSIRFEYFLVMLKNADFIIGNSSAGIREAPYYGVPTINIGTRQENRALHSHIINSGYKYEDIMVALNGKIEKVNPDVQSYGNGRSNVIFLDCLLKPNFWKINHQKQFVTLNNF